MLLWNSNQYAGIYRLVQNGFGSQINDEYSMRRLCLKL